MASPNMEYYFGFSSLLLFLTCDTGNCHLGKSKGHFQSFWQLLKLAINDYPEARYTSPTIGVSVPIPE